MTDSTTVRMQRCLDRVLAGEHAAYADLITFAQQRLLHLARKMLHDPRNPRPPVEAEDVCQASVLRLWRTFQNVREPPATLRDFFNLAAWHVRNELCDLARELQRQGPVGEAQPLNGCSGSSLREDPSDSSVDPKNLASWEALHEAVGRLPDDQREVFELLWYDGLTHEEAAAAVQMSATWVRSRWQRATVQLYRELDGQPPVF